MQRWKGLRISMKYRFIIFTVLILLLVAVPFARDWFKNEGKLNSSIQATGTPRTEWNTSPNVGSVLSPQPSDAAGIPATTSAELFTFAACEADYSPASGHSAEVLELNELPRGKKMSGIKAISTGKMTDEAGYGFQFGASYALHEDGTLKAWGLRNFGTPFLSASFPETVTGLPTMIQTEGEFAVSATGEVWFLNHGKTPYAIQNLNDVSVIRQDGYESLIILKADHSIWTWHKVDGNPHGKLSRISMKDAKQIYADSGRFYVIQTDGTLWEANAGWSMMSEESVFSQVHMPQAEKVTQVNTTMIHNKVFIQTDQGEWYEYNPESPENPEDKFRKVPLLQDMVKVTGNQSEIAAIKKDGTVWRWDNQSELMHSEGYIGPLNQAVQVQDVRDAVDVQAGSDHILILTQSGNVLSWGSNMYGQLGRESFYYDQFITLGIVKNVEGIHASWNGLYLFGKDGVWRLNENKQVSPVMQGISVKKVIERGGDPVYLTNSGELLLQNPESNQCQMLKATTPILDAGIGNSSNIIVLLQNNQVYEVALDQQQVREARKITFDSEPSGNISQIMYNVLLMVFTDEGKMYVQNPMSGNMRVMKQVSDMPNIKEASPIYGSYYGLDGNIAKVLDQSGEVYNIELALEHDANSRIVSQQLKAIKTGDQAERLIGAMTLDKNGMFQEQEWFKVQAQLSKHEQIRFSSSFYYSAPSGEGQSIFYHVLVLQGGRIVWLGYSPFAQSFPYPDSVVYEQ